MLSEDHARPGSHQQHASIRRHSSNCLVLCQSETITTAREEQHAETKETASLQKMEVTITIINSGLVV